MMSVEESLHYVDFCEKTADHFSLSTTLQRIYHYKLILAELYPYKLLLVNRFLILKLL